MNLHEKKWGKYHEFKEKRLLFWSINIKANENGKRTSDS